MMRVRRPETNEPAFPDWKRRLPKRLDAALTVLLDQAAESLTSVPSTSLSSVSSLS